MLVSRFIVSGLSRRFSPVENKKLTNFSTSCLHNCLQKAWDRDWANDEYKCSRFIRLTRQPDFLAKG